MQLRLKSDFLDYYDHWFDRDGQVFERLSRSGLSRKEMLDYLKKSGEKTPRYGLVKEMAHLTERDLVVYLDQMAHRAEGKIKLPYAEALARYENYLCTEFIAGVLPVTTLRRLQVGGICIWLRYQSNDEWRSNYGDVNVDVVSHEEAYHDSIRLPLFAIDYVLHDTCRFAVDLNIAPQLKGTGVEDILSAKEVVEQIKRVTP